jgi:hypothetical protein
MLWVPSRKKPKILEHRLSSSQIHRFNRREAAFEALEFGACAVAFENEAPESISKFRRHCPVVGRGIADQAARLSGWISFPNGRADPRADFAGAAFKSSPVV